MDEKKLIEEMKNEVCVCCSNLIECNEQFKSKCQFMKIVGMLYDIGYRKQSKERRCGATENRYLEDIIESLRDVFEHQAVLHYEEKQEVIKQFAYDIKLEFYREFDEIIPSIMADKIDELVKKYTGE